MASEEESAPPPTTTSDADPDPYLFFGQHVTPGIPAPFARYLTLAMSLIHRAARADAEKYAKAVGRTIPLPDDVALAARAAVVPSSGFWEDVPEKLLAHERELEREKAEYASIEKELGAISLSDEEEELMKSELHEALLADDGGGVESLVPVIGELEKAMREFEDLLAEGPKLPRRKVEQHRWRPSGKGWKGKSAEEVELVRRIERANTEFIDWTPQSLIEMDVKRTVAHMKITDDASREELR